MRAPVVAAASPFLFGAVCRFDGIATLLVLLTFYLIKGMMNWGAAHFAGQP